MKYIDRLIFLLLFAVVLQSCDDNQRAKNYNDKTLVDQQGLAFIKTANISGLTEINVSRFAVKISKNPRVVSFAQMMIADHTQVGKELKTLAKQKLVDIPDTLTIDDQKKLGKMAMLYGAPYDKTYMKMMVDDHEKAVELFTETTQNKNSAVQNFAHKILPALKMHLDSAKAIYNSLK